MGSNIIRTTTSSTTFRPTTSASPASEEVSSPPPDTGFNWEGALDGLTQRVGTEAKVWGRYLGGKGPSDTVASAIGSLSAETRGQILNSLASSGRSRSLAAVRIIESSSWQKATAAQKQAMGDIMAKADDQGMEALADLAAQPERLFSSDFKGGTLVENLGDLANQPLNGAVKNATQAQLLTSVLAETAHPDENNNQDIGSGANPLGTCAPTALQSALLRDHPAEYARIIAGLNGTGQVTVAGGDAMVLQTEAYQRSTSDGRSPSEVMFQAAAMELADKDVVYDASTGVHQERGGVLGLRTDQQAYLAEQLFNQKFSFLREGLSDQEYFKGQLQKYLASGSKLPVTFSVKAAFTDPQSQQKVQGSHAMLLDRWAGDKIYLRNPWGPGKFDNSMLPGLTLEDPSKGIWSFPADKFSEVVAGGTAPLSLWSPDMAKPEAPAAPAPRPIDSLGTGLQQTADRILRIHLHNGPG